MNNTAKSLVWMLVTVILSLVAAWLIHPAVLLGTIIGVITTTIKEL